MNKKNVYTGTPGPPGAHNKLLDVTITLLFIVVKIFFASWTVEEFSLEMHIALETFDFSVSVGVF